MIAGERGTRVESQSVDGIEVKWESTARDSYRAKAYLDTAKRDYSDRANRSHNSRAALVSDSEARLKIKSPVNNSDPAALRT